MSEDEGVGAAVGQRRLARRRRVTGGRSVRHVVRVTAEEEARLVQLALAEGVSVSRLLVESVFASQRGVSAAAQHEMISELTAATRLLGAMSRNLNQLTKVANATGREPEDLAALDQAVRRVMLRLDGVADEWSLS